MRFFIVFAAIASCVNAYTLSGTSREAPYPSEVPISHVPFAAYGLPPQHIFSIKPSVQSEGFVAASLPASLPVSDVHSPIVLQTPGIPAESYGAPIVQQEQAFVAVPQASESLPLPQILTQIYNVQPIQEVDVPQQQIVSIEVPYVPGDSYGPPILSNEAQRIEASAEQLLIPQAEQSLFLPELSLPLFDESPREPFAAYGIPTVHEEPKTEANIPAAITELPIVSTDKPKTEASTEPLVISSAPEALPLPELTITISDEPAREPFAAYGAPTIREEPKTDAPIIPAAIYAPPIVPTEAPRIESTTQQLVIPPAPQALPLPQLSIPVFVEPPRQPFAVVGAPLFHEEPKTEAPIISPIAECGPYPSKGPVSHYGDAIIPSSAIVSNEPTIESSSGVLGDAIVRWF